MSQSENTEVKKTAEAIFENKTNAVKDKDSDGLDLSALKGIQGDLDIAVRYALRSMLMELTRSGRTLQQKNEIIQSVERAVLFAFDHDIGATASNIKQSGPYAKREAQLAALIAKLIDNTMLLKAGKELGE